MCNMLSQWHARSTMQRGRCQAKHALPSKRLSCLGFPLQVLLLALLLTYNLSYIASFSKVDKDGKDAQDVAASKAHESKESTKQTTKSTKAAFESTLIEN